jgi:undecaprenyl phosphate N,N'-diacetylbacillosamine 1-phosphate transferase
MYLKIIKPLIDRLGAFVLIVLFSPVILVTAVLVALKIGRPIVFSQQRPGLKGKIFTIYKFRTMTNDKDPQGNLLPDEKRLQGVGKTIRALSLDELPQLLNVLKGEMSFIGPRPLLVEYLPLYSPDQARRHALKPGITGLAQVNGRNAIRWEEKFRYDVEYVNTISFLLDLKILFLTIFKVVKKEGISQEGRVTMEKFNGSN